MDDSPRQNACFAATMEDVRRETPAGQRQGVPATQEGRSPRHEAEKLAGKIGSRPAPSLVYLVAARTNIIRSSDP
jgi:hypothetical protein